MGVVRGHANPQLQLEGHIATKTVEYAMTKVETALHHTPAPVLHVWLRLRKPARPTVAERPQARVEVDLNGVRVRAGASGTTIREAVDRMQDRLRAQLARGSWREQVRRRTGRDRTVRDD